MPDLESFYVRSMRGLWGAGYWVTWHPSMTMRLGEIGKVVKNRFVPIQTLTDLAVTISTSSPQHPREELICGLDGGVAVDLGGRASVRSTDPGSAGVTGHARVSFTRNRAVFAVFRKLVETRISDLPRLAEALLRLYWEGKWLSDQVVITHLVKAGSATILGSTASGANVDLALAGGAFSGPLTMADLGAQVRVINSSGVDLQLIATELTPFFRVVNLRKQWLGGVEIQYGSGHGLRSARPAMVPTELLEEAKDDPDAILVWPDQVTSRPPSTRAGS